MLGTLLLTAILTALGPPPLADAQVGATPIHLAVGFGVDTTTAPAQEIFALWRNYLTGRADSIRARSYWSPREQAEWTVYDLLSGYVYQGFSNFTVVHLAPAAGLDSTYLIRTLVSAVDDSTHDVRPLALYRVYVTRERGKWVLANPLPRLTRHWKRETIGSITFVYPPTHAFVRSSAAATGAFVDSLARAFDLPAPSPITYYFTDDLLEMFGALGLDYFPLGSDTVGGRSNTVDRLVFVGSSSAGEVYRHELAHVILQPLVGRGNTASLVMEGLMTWTGGSAGLDYEDLLPGLKTYINAHADLTLKSILTNPPPRVGTLDVGYDTFATLCHMIYEEGGLAALGAWLNAGREPDAVLSAAARLLHVPAGRLDAVWRRRLATLGAPTAQSDSDSTALAKTLANLIAADARKSLDHRPPFVVSADSNPRWSELLERQLATHPTLLLSPTATAAQRRRAVHISIGHIQVVGDTARVTLAWWRCGPSRPGFNFSQHRVSYELARVREGWRVVRPFDEVIADGRCL
jgi:hypothetical protein